VVGAEHLPDGLDHLGAAGRHDDHVATGGMVLLDQVDRLVVHQWLDDVVQRVGDDVAHRLHVPTGDQLRHELPHLLHLVVVGAADQVDELRVRAAEYGAPRDQPTGLELLAERERARPGDDGLVQVEERRGGPRDGAHAGESTDGCPTSPSHSTWEVPPR
jgi:hypothetical protein